MGNNIKMHKEQQDLLNHVLDSNERIFNALISEIEYLRGRVDDLESNNMLSVNANNGGRQLRAL